MMNSIFKLHLFMLKILMYINFLKLNSSCSTDVNWKRKNLIILRIIITSEQITNEMYISYEE